MVINVNIGCKRTQINIYTPVGSGTVEPTPMKPSRDQPGPGLWAGAAVTNLTPPGSVFLFVEGGGRPVSGETKARFIPAPVRGPLGPTRLIAHFASTGLVDLTRS